MQPATQRLSAQAADLSEITIFEGLVDLIFERLQFPGLLGGDFGGGVGLRVFLRGELQHIVGDVERGSDRIGGHVIIWLLTQGLLPARR